MMSDHAAGLDEVMDERETVETSDKSGKQSAATQLVKLALDRYHFGISEDGQSYALEPGRHVVRMLRGGRNSLRAEIAKAFFKRYKKAAPQQALADALLILEGEAQDQEPDRVHLRVAAADSAIWLDLGDPAETVVKIDAAGWTIVHSDVPVLFRRTELSAALPLPSYPGNIDSLFDHLNVSVADRPLVLAWLVAAIIDPDSPHPILSLFGEQGTGKSSASRRIVAMVDPSSVPLRKPPRDSDQWVTAAQGSWVVGLDNLSQVPEWLSDSLCRAATGDGDVRRALYTDGGLAVFAFLRCILLNGIDVGALRGDLADRVVKINLDRIAETDRLTERQLAEEWRAAYPNALGGLLSLAAETLLLLPSVRLTSSSRMADFARILAATDEHQGTNGLARFTEQARSMAEDSLSSDPFLAALDEAKIDFVGRAAELLIKARPDSEKWRAPKDWPKDARAVTTLLRRNAPAMRKAGWIVNDNEDGQHFTVWTVVHPEKVGKGDPSDPSNPPATDQTEQTEHKNGQAHSGLCLLCGEAMTVVETGQRTHPNCWPVAVRPW
jgi:hypothetical protein